MAKLAINELADRCSAELTRIWATPIDRDWEPYIPTEVRQTVERSINSATKTYRYVLPTQVLAKVIDPSLDCRSLQEGSELAGSFDARSLCHKVVVPFDRANHNVLGGAPEPYVNNPLRVPSITSNYRAAQKNKSGFDDLCLVLDFLKAHSESAIALLKCVLETIRTRMDSVVIVYPVPNRVSLKQTMGLIEEYQSQRTGGVRLQAVSVALFRS